MSVSLSDLGPDARRQALAQMASRPRPVAVTARRRAERDVLVAYLDATLLRLAPDLGRPAAEHRFALAAAPPILPRPRRWAWDRAWVAERVAVEVHGATLGRPVVCHACGATVRARRGDGSPGGVVMVGGRHTRGAGFERDRLKVATGQALGWVALELTGPALRGLEWLAMLRHLVLTRRGSAEVKS